MGRSAPLASGPHRSIRVHGDDQRVTLAAGVLQVAHVARMQQIEHAVGEDDGQAAGAEPLSTHWTASGSDSNTLFLELEVARCSGS